MTIKIDNGLAPPLEYDVEVSTRLVPRDYGQDEHVKYTAVVVGLETSWGADVMREGKSLGEVLDAITRAVAYGEGRE